MDLAGAQQLRLMEQNYGVTLVVLPLRLQVLLRPPAGSFITPAAVVILQLPMGLRALFTSGPKCIIQEQGATLLPTIGQIR